MNSITINCVKVTFRNTRNCVYKYYPNHFPLQLTVSSRIGVLGPRVLYHVRRGPVHGSERVPIQNHRTAELSVQVIYQRPQYAMKDLVQVNLCFFNVSKTSTSNGAIVVQRIFQSSQYAHP